MYTAFLVLLPLIKCWFGAITAIKISHDVSVKK